MEIFTRWKYPTIDELRKENEKLNNIMYELEQWLIRLINNFDENVSESIMREQCIIRFVYDYLQYLKENNNERK